MSRRASGLRFWTLGVAIESGCLGQGLLSGTAYHVSEILEVFIKLWGEVFKVVVQKAIFLFRFVLALSADGSSEASNEISPSL